MSYQIVRVVHNGEPDYVVGTYELDFTIQAVHPKVYAKLGDATRAFRMLLGGENDHGYNEILLGKRRKYGQTMCGKRYTQIKPFRNILIALGL